MTIPASLIISSQGMIFIAGRQIVSLDEEIKYGL